MCVMTHGRVCQLSTNYGQNIMFVLWALLKGSIRCQMVGQPASVGGTVAVIINVRRYSLLGVAAAAVMFSFGCGGPRTWVRARVSDCMYCVCLLVWVCIYSIISLMCYVPSALYRKQNYRFFPLSPKLYQEPKQRTTIIAHRLIIGRQPVYPAYLDYCVAGTDGLVLVTFWTIYKIGALCRRDRRGKSYSFFVHTPLTPSPPDTHTLSSFVAAAVRKKPLTKRSTDRGRYWFSTLDTLTQIFPLFF